VPALEIQRRYLEAVERFLQAHHPDDAEAQHVALEWRRVLETLDRDPMALARELDWVAKLQLIEAYRDRHGKELDDPSVAVLDLAFHDISPETGLYQRLERDGRVARLADDAAVEAAMTSPPPTTRAALRSRFLSAAREASRDVTVDWVHLKVNGEVPQTVMCKDPLIWDDARVDRLIAGLQQDAEGTRVAGATS